MIIIDYDRMRGLMKSRKQGGLQSKVRSKRNELILILYIIVFKFIRRFDYILIICY